MQTDVVENPHSQKNKPEKKDQNNQKDNFDDHDMAQAKTEPETGHIPENRNQNITDDAITMPKVEESKILDKHDNKCEMKEGSNQDKEEHCAKGREFLCQTLTNEVDEPDIVGAQTKRSSIHQVNSSHLIPGQSKPGMLPSTSLTSREFTKVKTKRVTSLRFPCVANRLQKELKKVNTLLFIVCSNPMV